MVIALQESVDAIASSRRTLLPTSLHRSLSRIDRVWFLCRNNVPHGRNSVNGVTDHKCRHLGMVNSGHTIQTRNANLKLAEVRTVNDSLLRSGFKIACPSIGLSMIDPNAVASELETISSSTLLANMLARFVLFLRDLDPGTAQLVTSFVGPFIIVFNLLFIFRIILSWYPEIPVKKCPFYLAYISTEPVFGPTRRLIPPVGGVDVAPVIWVALMSFANEIVLGKQGLLVLLSQQQS